MENRRIKTAFIIMPFSQTTERHTEAYWTRFFESFLKPQMEKLGYVCMRSQAQPESIVKGILNSLVESDLAIAVLTDYNANVWYELGIRHCLRRGTVMMMESGQRIPFDIGSYGVLIYDDSLAGHAVFEAEITRFVERIERDRPIDSPAQEFLGREMVREIEHKGQLKEKEYERKIEEVVHTRPEAERARRILWVDDRPENNDFLVKQFQQRDVEFEIVTDTQTALERLKGRAGEYSLIITDMGRGIEWDAGIRLLDSLRDASYAGRPPVVVFCSRRATERFGERAIELGAVEVTDSPGHVARWIEKAAGLD